MFTGLVQALGRVAEVDTTGAGARLTIEAPRLELSAGDSIMVNGVCLTAVDIEAGSFSADLSSETMARTALGDLRPADQVNLELALRPSDRLGGHIVQGHVDGVGTVRSAAADGAGRTMRVQVPGEVMRYVVEKGSIAVDGVSLTVAALDDQGFSVALIPETLERTNLTHADPGRRVNLEVDVLAKYVEKLVNPEGSR